MPPGQLKNPKHRKALIYGGMAAAMLLIFLLSRRSSSASSSTDPNATTTATAQPASNPAVDPSSYGSGANGVDYSSQLATIDTDVNTLAQAVQANANASQTPGTTTASGTVDPTQDLATILPLITAASAAGVATYQAGAASVTPQRTPGPGNTKPKPAATKPKPSKPKPAKTTKRRPGP